MPFKITTAPRFIIDTTDVGDRDFLELTLEDDTKLFVCFLRPMDEPYNAGHFVLDRRWLPIDLIKATHELALSMIRNREYQRQFAGRQDRSVKLFDFLQAELLSNLRIDFSSSGPGSSGMPDVGSTFKVHFHEPGSGKSSRLGWNKSWPAVRMPIKSITEGSEYEADAYTVLQASRETE